MTVPRLGLSHVLTPRLEALYRALLAGRLTTPVTPQSLMLAGFADVCDELGVLAGVDAAGVRAALVIALAERKVVAARAAGR